MFTTTLSVLALMVSADPLPDLDKLDKIFEQAKSERADELRAKLKAEKLNEASIQRAIKTGAIKSGGTALDKSLATIADLEADLKTLDLYFEPTVYFEKIGVGKMGVVEVDSKRHTPIHAVCVQAIDDNNALIKLGPNNLVWYTGNVKGWVDDEIYKMDRILYFPHTRQYKTALGGSRTALEVQAGRWAIRQT